MISLSLSLSWGRGGGGGSISNLTFDLSTTCQVLRQHTFWQGERKSIEPTNWVDRKSIRMKTNKQTNVHTNGQTNERTNKTCIDPSRQYRSQKKNRVSRPASIRGFPKASLHGTHLPIHNYQIASSVAGGDTWTVYGISLLTVIEGHVSLLSVPWSPPPPPPPLSPVIKTIESSTFWGQLRWSWPSSKVTVVKRLCAHFHANFSVDLDEI